MLLSDIRRRAATSLVTLLLAVVAGGCVSSKTAKQDQLKAYEKGRQKAMEEQARNAEAQQPAVFFQGDVRNPRVPWREGLTLAEALLAAQYTWGWDPRTITVSRDGQKHRVNPKNLLRGQENPVLEAGDVIEVRH